MTIEHQIVTDEDGRPTAALIPWERFQKICEDLEESYEPTAEEEEAIAEAEKDREEGNWEAFTDLETLREEFAEIDAAN